MNAYASDKILAHLPVIQQLRDGEQPAPIYVHFVISDLCNQACNWCAYRSFGYESNELFKVIDPDSGVVNNNPNRMIPKPMVFGILNDLQMLGTKAVLFTGGGEPTTHPQHKEIIRRSHSLGLDFALTTNGTNLTDELCEILMSAKWVRVSLDAATAETYAKTRSVQLQTFRRVIENIQRLCRCRDTWGSRAYVGVGFVVARDNWHEVEAAARLAKECGANSFRISAAFTTAREAYFAEWGNDAIALCETAEQLTDDNFHVVNMLSTRITDLGQGAPDYVCCHYMKVVTYIGADQNVYRCCDTAYNPRGLIGSLKEQSFRQLWQSQYKEDDFNAFDARGCSWCQFNSRNRSIEATVNPPLMHENFL